ncbi:MULTISPECIES: NUDIX domain-containing protein [unclassified Dysgonomonas]|uniref:NUDIX hydrolase n=1 Tax=unclassified Dysgonomonas TaxID=2630389 RepID=UPI002473A0F1|nr:MULTISPECIES: NUDIX domain-containing protein [unclassified Dysgonomonas]MDH6388622.1 isopentenyldiphosphate isomerase [Dysgonomonas sp. PH5-37]
MVDEIFPLVDELGNVVGRATRRECHGGTMWLHPVIHLHVFNTKGELFLQKRSPQKDIQPGKWDSSVGGHIGWGETPMEAVDREACEEIGMKDFVPVFITKYIIETPVERELTYCFYIVTDSEIVIDGQEVTDGRYWSIAEIGESLNKDIFTYNFEQDFIRFLSGGISKLKNMISR